MGALVDALSAMIGATAEEEDEPEDARTTMALARSGATSLVRIAGKASLFARAPGEISLVRTDLRATPASLRCHHHQGGTTTTTRTKGLAASRSLAPSPAS